MKNCNKLQKKEMFFPCTVNNLNIPKYKNYDPLSENMDHSSLKAFLKS